MLNLAYYEIALQTNSTYYSAIKAIPYQVVFNCGLHYQLVDPSLRSIITEDNINDYLIDDEQDDALIRDKQRHLEAETCLREEPNIDKADMTSPIASSKLTSLDPDATIREYSESLPDDLINLASISLFPNSVDDYESGVRSECLLVMPPKFDLYPELQSLSPHLQFL